MARDQIRTPLDIDRALFQACFNKITVTALRLARDNYIFTEKPLKSCTGVYTATTGIPCAHKIEDIREQGISLLPKDFHVHWHWDRHLTALAPPILEPLQVISYSQGKRPASSTRRLPSGFEATEDKIRKCGLCRLPGHTRASLRCPVNIRQVREELTIWPELTPDPATQLTPDLATQFIPRTTIQAILDSSPASQSTLKSALQSILDSGIELIPKSTLQSILSTTENQPIQLGVTSQANSVVDTGSASNPEVALQTDSVVDTGANSDQEEDQEEDSGLDWDKELDPEEIEIEALELKRQESTDWRVIPPKYLAYNDDVIPIHPEQLNALGQKQVFDAVLNKDGYLYHSQQEGQSERLDQYKLAGEQELEEEARKAVAQVEIPPLSPLPIRRKRAYSRKQTQLDTEVEERR